MYKKVLNMLQGKFIHWQEVHHFSWVVFAERLLQCFYLLTKNLNKHGKTEAATTVHHRLVGPRYVLSPTEPITITQCISLKVQTASTGNSMAQHGTGN